jgi:hypothetical protein
MSGAAIGECRDSGSAVRDSLLFQLLHLLKPAGQLVKLFYDNNSKKIIESASMGAASHPPQSGLVQSPSDKSCETWLIGFTKSATVALFQGRSGLNGDV